MPKGGLVFIAALKQGSVFILGDFQSAFRVKCKPADVFSYGGQSALPVIPAPVAIVRVHIIGSVLLTLGLPDYRALADVCLSQLTS